MILSSYKDHKSRYVLIELHIKQREWENNTWSKFCQIHFTIAVTEISPKNIPSLDWIYFLSFKSRQFQLIGLQIVRTPIFLYSCSRYYCTICTLQHYRQICQVHNFVTCIYCVYFVKLNIYSLEMKANRLQHRYR